MAITLNTTPYRHQPRHHSTSCTQVVEMDRNWYAREHGYSTVLSRMTPLSATPKNDVIVGVHRDLLALRFGRKSLAETYV